MTLMLRYLFLILALLPINSWALLDGADTGARQRQKSSLRWHQVKGAPIWFEGETPKVDKAWGLAKIELKPQQSVTLHLAQGQWLRLYHPQQAIDLANLSVQVSNGTGLFARATTEHNTAHLRLYDIRAKHTVLLSPDVDQARLVKIQSLAQQPLALCALVSVIENPPSPDYHQPLSLDLPQVSLTLGNKASALDYWQLATQQITEIKVKGPQRIQLSHYFIYPKQEQGLLQVYRVYLDLIDPQKKQSPHISTHATRFDSEKTIAINGTIRILGRVQHDYIDVPKGEYTLRLQSDAPLYLRLLSDQQNFLLPQLNGEQKPPVSNPLHQWLNQSEWQLDAHKIKATADLLNNNTCRFFDQQRTLAQQQGCAEIPVLLEKISQRLAMDNHYQDGGLAAMMLLRRAALYYPHFPQLPSVARHILGNHSFYRNLLPWQKPANSTLQTLWFASKELQPPERTELTRVVSQQHYNAYLAYLEQGQFIDLIKKKTELTYRLPARDNDSLLRLLVAGDAKQPLQLAVQFDLQPPFTLQLQPSNTRAQVYPSMAEAALLAQAEQQKQNGATLSGAFGAQQANAERVNAHEAVFDLPADVATVKITVTAPEKMRHRLAVQYRASKPFALSETAYGQAAKQIPKADLLAFFLNQLQGKTLPPANNRFIAHAQADLSNHWWPLIRFLRNEQQAFISHIPDDLRFWQGKNPECLRQQSDICKDNQEVKSLQTHIQSLMKAEQWLLALEQTTRLAQASNGETHRQAQMQRVALLKRLGEAYLAERLLIRLFMDDSDPLLSQQAYTRLRQDARDDKRATSVLPLLVTAVMRQPSRDNLLDLAEVLIDNGYSDYGLQLALLFDYVKAPDFLLLALHQNHWQQGLNHYLTQASAAQQAFWAGYQAQQNGQYDLALAHWGKGDAQSAAYQKSLKTALALASKNHSLTSLQQWDAWQQQQPQWQWTDANDVVSDYQHSLMVENPARSLYFQVFVASHDKPVILQLDGAETVRLEVRALSQNDRPLDAWLQIKRLADNKSGEQSHVLALNQVMPSQGLSLVGDGRRLSQQTLGDYSFGAGHHTLELRPSKGDTLAIKVYRHQPLLPLGALPRLTAATLAAPTQVNPVIKTSQDCSCHDCILFVPHCRALSLADGLLLDLDNNLAYQNAKQTAQAQLNQLAAQTTGRPKVLCRRGVWQPPVDLDDSALLDYLNTLVWCAKSQPQRAQTALSVGEALLQRYPLAPAQSLWSMLARDSEWQQLSTIDRSAGIESQTLQGWWPETPSVRVRKTLLKPLKAHEMALTGHQRLGFSWLKQNGSQVTLSLQMDDGLFKPLPLTVEYGLENQKFKKLTLNNNQAKQTVLSVPQGLQTLLIQMTHPWVNQFLRVSIHEQQPVLHEQQRLYHVATTHEPVVLDVEGPLWLRVDEFMPALVGQHKIHYHSVAQGLQSLTFKPANGQSKRLLRFYGLLMKNAPSPQSKKRHYPVTQQPLPPAWVKNRLPLEKINDVVDNYALGKQEQGTPSVMLSWHRRKNFEEDFNRSDWQQFMELRAQYRYYDDILRRHYKSDVFARRNRFSDLTLGGEYQINDSPRGKTYTWRSRAYAYGQSVMGETDWIIGATSTLLREIHWSPQWYHTPSLTGFARYLSRQHAPDDLSHALRLDNDVFSDYKADHRWGLSIADRFSYAPWQDTLLSIRPSLTSNEKLWTLDKFGLALDAQQWLGHAQLSAGYHYTHFFADDERDQAFDRHILALDLRYEHWQNNQNRWEAGVELRHNLESRDLESMLYFQWHGGVGRGYRDFAGHEIDFKDLRERDKPWEDENELLR